jgi:hypothetical protein|tara:strand:- start:17 stop:382 length:366 start_codon:yes stop_codon:yes gene_type:complete
MAHYALLDENNIVTTVIVGADENLDGIDWEQNYADLYNQTCKRTSYNTYGNEHQLGGTPFRGNYAGQGFTYDTENDVFIAPKPYDSWSLDETTWTWKPPVEYPNDGKFYNWNEDTTSWIEV